MDTVLYALGAFASLFLGFLLGKASMQRRINELQQKHFEAVDRLAEGLRALGGLAETARSEKVRAEMRQKAVRRDG